MTQVQIDAQVHYEGVKLTVIEGEVAVTLSGHTLVAREGDVVTIPTRMTVTS
jgi:ethanolamine utilization protein EutQ (cupin superfamily)